MKMNRYFLIALMAWLGLVLVRLTGPDDLMSRDQERVASYIQDIVQNGNWVVQRDCAGNVASKPPMANWIGGLAATAFGGVNRFTYGFPSILASGIVVILLFVTARKHFGDAAAFWSVWLYLFSQLGFRQVLLVRSDAVFQMFTFAAVLAGVRAWQQGRGWTLFYFMAALATMTKSPLGLILAAGGFIALFWERKEMPLRGNHLRGILLFFAIPLLWLLWAYLDLGDAVIQKLIHDELIGHAVGKSTDSKVPLARFYKPTAFFMTRVAPLAIIFLIALRRGVRDLEPDSRQLLRFCFCVFFTGLFFFSTAAHNRFVHLLPLIPLAALICGRIVAKWMPSLRSAGLASIMGIGIAYGYLHHYDVNTFRIVPSVQTRAFAKVIESKVGSGFPLMYGDAPWALQTHLQQFGEVMDMSNCVDYVDAEFPSFIAIKDFEAFSEAVTAVTNVPVYQVLKTELGEEELSIVSTHPRFELPEQWQYRVQGLHVFATHLKLVQRQGSVWILNSQPGRKSAVRASGRGTLIIDGERIEVDGTFSRD